MDPHEHGFIGFMLADGEMISWYRITDLWQEAAELSVEMIPVDTLAHFLDEVPRRYDGMSPTVREFAREGKRIFDADLSYPIILSAEGFLLDGRHRLGKAWAQGLTEIAVVRFEQNPKPYRLCCMQEIQSA